MMLASVVLACMAFTLALGSSPCPPRYLIYPCSCLNSGKRLLFTAVTCHRLSGKNALSSIMPTLSGMHIDHFALLDSFWGASEDQRALPAEWLRSTKIREMEIVDTALSDRFMCDGSTDSNTILTRFTAVNSTQSSDLKLCANERGSHFPWTARLEKLQYFQMSSGKLSSFRSSTMFQTSMNNLITLNLSRNKISVVDQGVFKNLPNLTSIDLSHNLIEHLGRVFDGDFLAKLIYLDVSFNHITTLGIKFPSLPALKTLRAGSNKIVNITEKEWEDIPENIREIELGNNPIHCDCFITWINGTVFQKKIKPFLCETPKEYKGSYFKTVAQGMLRKKECNPNITNYETSSPSN